MNKRVLAAASLIALAGTAHSDMITPSHFCSKPYKPYRFSSEWEMQRFQDEVEDYRQCIRDFVEEQEDAVSKHQAAAQDAIDEWNSFVSYELR